MNPKNLKVPDPDSHWGRAATEIDSEIQEVLNGLAEKNPDLQPDEMRDKYRSAIATYYGAAEDSTWDQIRDVALERWRWAIEQGQQNDWSFDRIKEAFLRGDRNDRSLLAGLEFASEPEALTDFWSSRVRELDEKLRQNQETIDLTGGDLKERKAELVAKLQLDPNTPILDVFDRADAAFGTTMVADILAGVGPMLKEFGKIPPDAGEVEVRAAAAEMFSEL